MGPDVASWASHAAIPPPPRSEYGPNSLAGNRFKTSVTVMFVAAVCAAILGAVGVGVIRRGRGDRAFRGAMNPPSLASGTIPVDSSALPTAPPRLP
jgi:hypothetical protein